MIYLHPKHGLNTTLLVCAFCGEDKNEIAVLGANYKEKAPHRMVMDLEPCDDCKKIFEQGILLIEVESKEKLLPVQAYAVITEDAAKRLFADSPHLEHILEHRKVFVDTGFIQAVTAK